MHGLMVRRSSEGPHTSSKYDGTISRTDTWHSKHVCRTAEAELPITSSLQIRVGAVYYTRAALNMTEVSKSWLPLLESSSKEESCNRAGASNLST